MARKTHDIRNVIEYWQNNMDEIPRSYAKTIGWSEPFCFACHRVVATDIGWKEARNCFELAHLSDFSVTGEDDVSDVIPLCSSCHRAMPAFLKRQEALDWLNSPERQKHNPFKALPQRAASSVQTAAALKVLKQKGVRLGRPRLLSKEIGQRIVAERANGKTLMGIANDLTNEGVPTAHGGVRWYASTVAGALASATLDNESMKLRKENSDFPV